MGLEITAASMASGFKPHQTGIEINVDEDLQIIAQAFKPHQTGIEINPY